MQARLGANPKSGRAHPPAMVPNVERGWKLLTVTNTLLYHNAELITSVKRLIVQAPGFRNDYKK
jgi:hypothetical protein